jgi:RimJ/RimL family protein N-acetyltransferase
MEERLKLKFTTEDDLIALLNYDLPESQANFTALPKLALERLEKRSDNDANPITILLNDEPIGFFILDFGDDKLELTDNKNSLLLRSLSINPRYQGNGYGKIVMNLMDDFVKEYYPTINEMVLAVNKMNISAYNLYLKVGYKDNGSERDWFNGKQHLLKKKL